MSDYTFGSPTYTPSPQVVADNQQRDRERIGRLTDAGIDPTDIQDLEAHLPVAEERARAAQAELASIPAPPRMVSFGQDAAVSSVPPDVVRGEQARVRAENPEWAAASDRLQDAYRLQSDLHMQLARLGVPYQPAGPAVAPPPAVARDQFQGSGGVGPQSAVGAYANGPLADFTFGGAMK